MIVSFFGAHLVVVYFESLLVSLRGYLRSERAKRASSHVLRRLGRKVPRIKKIYELHSSSDNKQTQKTDLSRTWIQYVQANCLVSINHKLKWLNLNMKHDWQEKIKIQLYQKDNWSDYCSCSNNNIHNHLDFNSNLREYHRSTLTEITPFLLLKNKDVMKRKITNIYLHSQCSSVNKTTRNRLKREIIYVQSFNNIHNYLYFNSSLSE
jgi:hypothetical protein